MTWNPFKNISEKFLGVDIGAFSIKIVELSGRGDKGRLENYGELASKELYEKPFRSFKESSLSLSSGEAAQAISDILKEAKIRSKKAIFSIPDFSTFFTNFTLPAMSEKELPQAVKYEARQHVPVPLNEVTYDWKLIGGKPSGTEPLKILLVSVHNDVISQYQEIAGLVGLELKFLEAEVFGLARSLLSEKGEPACLIDFGAQSTTINIVDEGILKISHSFDLSGNKLTYQISRAFKVSHERAEELKRKYGLSQDLKDSLIPMVSQVLEEARNITESFEKSEEKEIKKIVLAGGGALMPGLQEHFTQSLARKVELANPFSKVSYPQKLEEALGKMGPSYAIAVGAAMRGLE